MILDNARLSHLGPDGKITKVERKRRQELNLCMRCGRPGHRVRNCDIEELRLQESYLDDGFSGASADQGKD